VEFVYAKERVLSEEDRRKRYLLHHITKLTWCPEIVALAPCPMATMTKNCSSWNVVIIKIFLLDTSRMKNTKSHKAPVT
jgi:hypothetical protein